jgi:isoleucyl-tRNA synthetase
MPFSSACNTVLSNFEAGSNYKDVPDPVLIVTFPLEEDPNTNFIAWTTTPWTLPSNLALAVNPKFTYLKIVDEDKQKTYILAESRLKDMLKQANIKKHKVLEKIPGESLLGKRYIPLFNYFAHMKEQNCFTVIAGDFVTSDTGTGIVHCAPGFGEDDYSVCLKNGLIQPGKAPVPIDFDGKLTDVISDFKGIYIKTADPLIKDHLKQAGRLVHSGTEVHSYPFCWRSQTPLIYRAFDTWFIKVTDIKE